MKKKNEMIDITENPLYHNTWKLLKKYRDAWNFPFNRSAIGLKLSTAAPSRNFSIPSILLELICLAQILNTMLSALSAAIRC